MLNLPSQGEFCIKTNLDEFGLAVRNELAWARWRRSKQRDVADTIRAAVLAAWGYRIWLRGRPVTTFHVQAAARLVVRRACLGGGMSRSAGSTRKRARNRCTIVMLSSFLPPRTSLTRLGVPRIGTMSARVRPC